MGLVEGCNPSPTQIKNVRLVLLTSILRGSDRRRDLCRPRDPQAPPLSSYRTKLASLELKTRCRSMDHEGGDESGERDEVRDVSSKA